jgi:aspartate carbamoyltransferase
MKRNGFEVRTWPSLESYVDAPEVADTWYFTRLQLERMGDEVRDRAPELRRSVTFRREYLDRLPEGVRFYHPLPRHREHPVIPSFLDATPLNGWDPQSINGYFTRIVELALVAGALGEDFTGETVSSAVSEEDFVESIPVTRITRVEDRYKVGIKPVDDGIVIDHIARGLPEEEIWDRVDRIRRILKLNVRSSHGVFHSGAPDLFKGIISLPDVMEVDRKDLKKLAAVSPECTLNIVKDRSVIEKYRLHMPPKIYNFEEISCRNEACITYPSAHQHVPVSFYRDGEESFACRYCGRHHGYHEIWDI